MNLYLQKLLNEKYGPVIFDYDGVLFEARWYEERINMPNATEEKLKAAMLHGENLFTRPIPFMKELVNSIKTDIFVLSYMSNDIEHKNKVKEISMFYPKIPKENILRAKSPEDKIQFLDKIKQQYGKFIYIDDTMTYLQVFEDYFPSECKFFHVSSLYV